MGQCGYQFFTAGTAWSARSFNYLNIPKKRAQAMLWALNNSITVRGAMDSESVVLPPPDNYSMSRNI